MTAAPEQPAAYAALSNPRREDIAKAAAPTQRSPVRSRMQAVVSGVMVGAVVALFMFLGGCNSTQTRNDQLVASITIGAVVAAILAWHAWPGGTLLERRVRSPIDAVTSGLLLGRWRWRSGRYLMRCFSPFTAGRAHTPSRTRSPAISQSVESSPSSGHGGTGTARLSTETRERFWDLRSRFVTAQPRDCCPPADQAPS